MTIKPITSKQIDKPTDHAASTALSAPLISVENVSVMLGNKTVLSNIHLDLLPHDIISIIGPNGGGKSTLLKTIAGLIPVTSGTIKKQKQLRVGYVPQRFTLPNSLPLRVSDFLALSKQNVKAQVSAQIKQHSTHHTRHASLIDQFELKSLLNSQMQSLSGGELQRVLLANALNNTPHVVMLDEPMQGLDPDAQAELYALIRELPRLYGCAVMIVSHDLHWVMQGTNHVICINQHVCCEGVPEKIQSESAFQHLYRTNYLPSEYAQSLAHAQQHEHAGETFYTHHHHCEHEHDCDANSH